MTAAIHLHPRHTLNVFMDCHALTLTRNDKKKDMMTEKLLNSICQNIGYIRRSKWRFITTRHCEEG